MSIRSLRSDIMRSSPGLSALKTRLRQFQGDERGALLIFGMILMILMLIIGGFALNMMRYERMRVDLSQTLDRASLAAASLSQQLDPETVVRDYMKKQGLDEYLTMVKVTSAANGRIVQAEARADVPFYFANFIGIDSLPAIAGSKARQDITDLEIILVLDVSGSMREDDGYGKQKIVALREAAKEFVDQMLPNADAAQHISIGIVPYNAQVNLGPTLISKYNVANNALISGKPHGLDDVHCLELPASQFTARPMSRTTPMQRLAYADTVQGTDTSDRSLTKDHLPINWFCGSYSKDTWELPSGAKFSDNYVIMPTSDASFLKGKIEKLFASGNTSITLGMKWGSALIDPSARSIYSDFVATGDIPSQFDGRPFEYDNNETMKVIVLMTDGTHVSHSTLKDVYKTGTSPIWKAADGTLSIAFPYASLPNKSLLDNVVITSVNQPMYWVPGKLSSQSDAYTNGTKIRQAWQATPYDNNTGDGISPVNMTWQQVWKEKRVNWVMWHMYARALGGKSSSTRNSLYSSYNDAFIDNWKSVTDMDTQLQSTCNLMKNTGPSNYPVKVFGIAFNAPEAGKKQIRDCATSQTDPYFFEVKPGGTTIKEAFAAIGSTISNLRLTQ